MNLSVLWLYPRRTVKDKLTGQNVVVSEADAELIKRFHRGKYVDPSYDKDEVLEFPLKQLSWLQLRQGWVNGVSIETVIIV